MICISYRYLFFFFNDTATTEIYTLSLHDALPISMRVSRIARPSGPTLAVSSTTMEKARFSGGYFSANSWASSSDSWNVRSEEHTSELQSRQYLVCRLLLEKKKHNKTQDTQ